MPLLVSDDELSVLAGDNNSSISYPAKIAYLLAIRPHMDSATRMVGYKRTVSYQSITEVLEYVPPKGSTAKAEKITKDRVRAVLNELERVGLIRWIKSQERGLFFECLMGGTDKSVQNHEHTVFLAKNAPKNTPCSYPKEASQNEGFMGAFIGDERTEEHGALFAKNTPPLYDDDIDDDDNAGVRESVSQLDAVACQVDTAHAPVITEVPALTGSARAGQIARLLIGFGIRVSPTDPRVVAWSVASVSDAQIAECLERVRLYKPLPETIHIAYFAKTLDSMLAKAKKNRQAITAPSGGTAPVNINPKRESYHAKSKSKSKSPIACFRDNAGSGDVFERYTEAEPPVADARGADGASGRAVAASTGEIGG